MTNLKLFMKRLCAYIIDLFVILIISSVISSIPTLNKGMDEYQKTYKEYEEKYNIYADYINLIKESYEDKEITEEEYIKLTESKEYKEIILSKYDDNKISEKEYQKIISETTKEFDKVASDYVYILGKKGVFNSIITLICTLLYFGILQYLLKGQTLGKKIFKLKVISASDKKLNIFNYLLRSLLVNDILLNSIGIVFLLFASKSLYNKAETIISILISIVEALIVFQVLKREDQRGLHDLLFNTKVISNDENKEKLTETKDNKKIIEAEIEETQKEADDNGKRKQKTSRRKK